MAPPEQRKKTMTKTEYELIELMNHNKGQYQIVKQGNIRQVQAVKKLADNNLVSVFDCSKYMYLVVWNTQYCRGEHDHLDLAEVSL